MNRVINESVLTPFDQCFLNIFHPTRIIFPIGPTVILDNSVVESFKWKAYTSNSEYLTLRTMSFMNNMNISGPRMDLWGTPSCTWANWYSCMTIIWDTLYARLCKHDLHQPILSVLQPYRLILWCIRSWSTRSNAFLRSIRSIPVNSPLSTFAMI